MSKTNDEYGKLLDQLNEEFADALSLALVDPDDVREWGCSCTVVLNEYIEALGTPEQMMLDVRGMPIWHFYDSKGDLDLYIVQLNIPGMEHLTLSFNTLEPIAGRDLEVF